MAEETPRKGLGRGLSALMGDDSEDYAALDQVKSQKDLPIEFLMPSPFQPRHRFDENDLRDLVASVREHGILQPILVRRHGDTPDRYEILAGERRWRAAQQARLTKVPVVIKDFNDEEALEVACTVVWLRGDHALRHGSAADSRREVQCCDRCVEHYEFQEPPQRRSRCGSLESPASGGSQARPLCHTVPSG